MNEPPAPFAAGVHLPWADVPEEVHEWAADLGGGTPHRVDDLEGGFSPGAIARLGFAGGPDIFVKAVGTELNPVSPHFHRREGVISAALPASPLLPRLIGTYDDGDWVALAFAVIDGHLPRHPWREDELDIALYSLERLHEVLTPSPSPEIPPVSEYHQATFGSWNRLASLPDPPAMLDDWSRRHLILMADIESGWAEASAGSTLLHGDIRSDNMLLVDDVAVFVDWPHASVGTPVLDLICWAPSVALEGGPDPEDLLSRYHASRSMKPEVVTVLVAAVAGFLIEGSLRPPPPGLPTLRPFQAAQGEVARAWLQRRIGVR